MSAAQGAPAQLKPCVPSVGCCKAAKVHPLYPSIEYPSCGEAQD